MAWTPMYLEKKDVELLNTWLNENEEIAFLVSNTSIGRFIDDPWSGWTEIRAGANRGVPYFGVGHVGIISLNIHLAYNNGAIPISHFGWIGNHYKVIGNGAEKSTELFWNKLKCMVKKVAVQIPRCNRLETKKEVFAFPSAYSAIRNGRLCSLN